MNAAWLRRYGNGYHQWKETRAAQGGSVVYYRPLGIVETGFDSDGTDYGGRADMHSALSFEFKTTMSTVALRKHITLAFACLRLRHALLCATAASAQEFMDQDAVVTNSRFMIVRKPRDHEDAIQSTHDILDFLEDYYPRVDPDELHHHAQNTARVVDPDKSLVRLFVLPLEKTPTGTFTLRFLFVLAHQISDGLAQGTWIGDFLRLINQNSQVLENSISPLITTLHQRLPEAQEDLYKPVTGTRARRRWFWAITIVLRHVRKPLPVTFQNPLRFTNGPVAPAPPTQKLYDRILDYTSNLPPLNAGTVRALVGKEGTHRLHRVCRQVGCSIGAGSFALVAIVMMELYEERFPDVPTDQRLPFIGSFPVNPRPFFNHTAEPDSMMLAFSDGVVLPFLSSDLDLDGRIKLLVRSAQRQLARYQKRPPRDSSVDGLLEYMGPRGAGRLVPMTYLDTIERMNVKLPDHRKETFPYQEHLPMKPNPNLATCGVSSVGRMDPSLRPGQYDLQRPLAEDEFKADLREMKFGVRPRDGEFLVGIMGSDDFISAGVSYDACAIDPAWAEIWRDKMETILGGSDRPRL